MTVSPLATRDFPQLFTIAQAIEPNMGTCRGYVLD